MMTGSPPSITATQEFVVPRSIPMILDIHETLLTKVQSNFAPQGEKM